MAQAAMQQRMDLWDNPVGTDGFEFIEFTAPDPAMLGALFEQLGFVKIARHRSKAVFLYRQGDINFILNEEKAGHPKNFRDGHGPSICAMAFRVADAAAALARSVGLGATSVAGMMGPGELAIPAIEGIGGSLLYFVDRYGDKGSIYDVDFEALPGVDQHPVGVGLTVIDHLTHNVFQGKMEEWADFYTRLFNFRQIRYFDIEGKLTGLKSKAMTSPDGKIRIPINESSDDKSQIVEYLDAYRGEGIQHVALGTHEIYTTIEALRDRAVRFLNTPDSYYDLVDKRLPGHGEDVPRLRANKIQIDGAPGETGGRLLQIFTETVIGPIFFEIIQRKGDEGFGEGNFKALFEAMELDQIRRGVLKDE